METDSETEIYDENRRETDILKYFERKSEILPLGNPLDQDQ